MASSASRLPTNVLVVEDNPLLAELLVVWLTEDLGVPDVTSCWNVGMAIVAMEQQNFDLAVIDIQLGEENGLLVAERCASQNVPVILASGYVDLMLPVAYRSEQLLAKPYTMTDLKKAIQRLMARTAVEPG